MTTRRADVGERGGGKSVRAKLSPYIVHLSYWDTPSFKLSASLLCYPGDFSHPSLQVKTVQNFPTLPSSASMPLPG